MSSIRRLLIGVLSLILFTQLALISPVTAQRFGKDLERERLNRVMDPNGDVEEFRRELTSFFREFEQVILLLNRIPAVRAKLDDDRSNTVAIIAQAKIAISTAAPEDLVVIRNAYAKTPNWRQGPSLMMAIIEPTFEEPDGRSASYAGGEKENAGIPDDCALAAQSGITNTDIAIAKGVLIGLQAAADIIPPVLNAIAVAAVAANEAVVLGLESSKAINDDCTQLDITAVQTAVDNATTAIINNNNSNTNSIVNNDNSNKTMLTTSITDAQTSINNTTNANGTAITTAITNAQTTIVNNDNANKNMIIVNDNSNKDMIVVNDNSNKDMIVANDNSNKDMIVANDNANTMALNDLILRSLIEADLATESNGVKIAWYMTPTANGGKLDLVQQIVTETLANIQAAGGSIGNAQLFLDRADADKAAGDFKSAYDNYRKAYKAAAN